MDKIEAFKKAILGFRKLSFVVLFTTVTTVCLACGILASEDYAIIWSTTGPAFFAASLTEHLMPLINDSINKRRARRSPR